MAQIQKHQTAVFKKLFIILLFALLPVSSANAQENLNFSVPISKIAPVNTTTLRGISNTYTLKIPIPNRWAVKKAVLHFFYVNSTALLQNRSRLVVWLNESPLAQITLSPTSPEGKVAVSLPVNLLKHGYNDLTFSVSQHYTTDCEDPSSPELWTTLEFDRSSIYFEIALKTVPLYLSSVSDFLFDPKMFTDNIVNIVVEDLSEDKIETAAIVASGIALRFDYRPVKFTLSQNLKYGYDNIVIGNKSFVSRISGDRSLDDKGAFLKIIPLLEDIKHAIIIVQGDSVENIKKAAHALSVITFPFPKAQSMRIDNIKNLSEVPPAGKGILIPGYEYEFREMGFSTRNFKGMVNNPSILEIRLPSDIFSKPNLYASFLLHLAYGSGMRKDSVLNIHVNGRFTSSIYLDNPRGAIFKDYRLDIPLDLFRPGYNTISFIAVLTPLVFDRCEFIQTENLQLTIFDDSKLQLPSFPLWTAMPDIGLFFNDAFPFSKPPDFRDTVIYLTEKNMDAAAAALNIIAIGAQKLGYPPSNISITFKEQSASRKNIIAVGSLATIPMRLLKSLPIQSIESGNIPYAIIKDFRNNRSTVTAKVHSFIDSFIPLIPDKNKTSYVKASVGYSGKLTGNWAMLSEFESPYKSGRTVLLFTSLTINDLLKGAYALWEPAMQGKFKGGMAVFDTESPDTTIASVDIGSRYYIGRLGLFTSLSALIYKYPFIFLLLLIGCLGYVSYFLYKKMKAFRKKREETLDS